MKEYKSFQEFWPFYLSQHKNSTCLRLHCIGTLCAFLIILQSVFFNIEWILLAPVIGYGFAWAGHFFFEKNKPATFQYPLWSLRGDLKLCYLMIFKKADLSK